MTRVWVLPGMDGTGRLSAPLAACLAGHDVRVVSYAPAHGDYETIAGALPAELRSPDPHDVLVAESFGGPLALRIAAEHPVRRLVLVASFVRTPRWLLPTWFVELAHPPPALAIRAGMVGMDAPRSLVESVAAALAAVPARTIERRIGALRSLDATDALRHARAPIVWLRASHDRLVPGAAAELARSVRADLVVHDVAGPHLLAQRFPERVASFVA